MKQRNKQQKRKVHSIRGQFAWIFIGLMIGTILLCLMINYLFLGKVYMQSKLDVIHDAYGTIKQAAESDSYDTEEFARGYVINIASAMPEIITHLIFRDTLF